MPVAHRPGGAHTGALAVALACLVAGRVVLGTGQAGLALDALTAVAALIATLEAGRRARPGRSRRGWRLETAALACWLLAPLAWLTDLPEAVATTGRVGFLACAGTAWWLTSLGGATRARVRLLVDAALAGGSAFVVAWSWLLEPAFARTSGGLAGRLAVSLPVAACAVATLAAGVALTEIPRRRRGMPRMYIAAFLLVGWSDLAWGRGWTPLWTAAFACVVLATRLYRGTSKRREVISTHPGLAYAPYALLAPALVVIAVHQAGGGVSTAEATTAVAMGILLVVRQHVTLAENRELVERLEATERRLRYQAMHDSLTGLGGRALLHERLDAATARHRRDGAPLAVVFVDLDDFKQVNDTLGHAAGDDVLVEVAHRLARALAPHAESASAFRMSGDEFAVLLLGDAAADAAATAEGLLAAISAPMRVGDEELALGGSVGVALAGDDVEPSALLRAADVAMYDVKHACKRGVGVATPGT